MQKEIKEIRIIGIRRLEKIGSIADGRAGRKM